MIRKYVEDKFDSLSAADKSDMLVSIIKMQSLPEEVVRKLIDAKGKFKRNKKGKLQIVKTAK